MKMVGETMDGPRETIGKPRLLAQVNLGRAEVDHHQNLTRVLVAEGTQSLKQSQS